MKRKIAFGIPTLSAIEDAWQRRATDAAIAAARDIVKQGVIPPLTPIGRLGDTEWGWLVATVLFAWIATRAEQATANGYDVETTIRTTGIDPDPWHAGAVINVLRQLADVPGIDWSQPLAEWPRQTVVRFLLEAVRLITTAIAARDASARGLTQPTSIADPRI